MSEREKSYHSQSLLDSTHHHFSQPWITGDLSYTECSGSLPTRIPQSSNTEGISKGYSKNNGPQLIEVWHEYRQLKGQKAATLKTWRQAVWIGFSLVPECGRKRSSRNISQVLTRRTKDGTAVDQKRGFGKRQTAGRRKRWVVIW